MNWMPAILGDTNTLSQRGGASQYLLMAAAVAAAVFAIAAIYFWNTFRKPLGKDGEASSQNLFLGLCENHALSRSERTLLSNLVRAYEMAQPAMLFVDPWSLDQAAAASDPDARQYEALREKLFGKAG